MTTLCPPESLQKRQVAREAPEYPTGHMEDALNSRGTPAGVTLLGTSISEMNVPRSFEPQQQHGKTTSCLHPQAAKFSLTKLVFPLLSLRYPPLTVLTCICRRCKLESMEESRSELFQKHTTVSLAVLLSW